MVGGGLGAQPFLAATTHEFLEEDLLVPYIEAVLRVFDRHGERASRHKARIKFLIQKIGIDAFNELVNAEQISLTCQRYKINTSGFENPSLPTYTLPEGKTEIKNPLNFEIWKKTNVFPQKQAGYFVAYVKVLTEVIEEEYPEFLYNKDIAIKISGCMNSCGQHGMASIGFHGSSLKAKGQVLPALQVLIGGGVMGSGNGSIADKVIKVPSKRGPDVLRSLLDDYKSNRRDGETYLQYTHRAGEKYFYDLLKPHASLETLLAEDYIDWGEKEKYATAIGVGECAGVMIDLVATLILEAEDKLGLSEECHENKSWADSIYHAYSAFVNTAKALLLQHGVQCNTQHGILKDFDTHFVQKGLYNEYESFKIAVLKMNDTEPSEAFAKSYLQESKEFAAFAKKFREQAILAEKVA